MKHRLALTIACCLLGARLFAGGNAPVVPSELLPEAREARARYDRADYAGAEKSYRKLLEAAPDDLCLLSNLASTLCQEGKYQLAERTLIKALEVNPKDALSYRTLGFIKYREGDDDWAVKALKKAVVLDPKNATAHNYLGLIAHRLGQEEDAVNEFKACVALDPNFADAWYNLAAVCAKLQPPEIEAARKSYRRALELGEGRDASLESVVGPFWGLGDFYTPVEKARFELSH